MKIKRITALLMTLCILFCAFAFSGCKDVEKYGKNLNNYTIAATYDDQNQKLSVVQTVEYTHRQDAEIDSVCFRVYANAYSQEAESTIVPVSEKVNAYKNGYSYGEASFDSVSVNGANVAYTVQGDGTLLCVPLQSQLFTNEKVEIQLVYEITLANIWHRLGYGDNTVNLGNWFAILCPYVDGQVVCDNYSPIGDPFVSDCANFSVKFYAPKEYIVAHSGQLSSCEYAETNTIYNIEGKCLRDFALVLSKNYNEISQTVGDTVVHYYFFNDDTPQETLTLSVEAFDYFTKLFGEYPFSQLSVCQTDFCFGGMEYSNLVYVSTNEDATVFKQAVVHEIAHQWLYGIIGNDQVRNAWQDEGLTEFATLLFFDANEQYGLTLSEQISQSLAAYTTYVDVLGSYLSKVDTSMNRALCDYIGQQEYVYINYVKGCLVFHDLYKTMGAAKFEKGCAAYYNQCRYTIASPSQLIETFSSAYGSDLTSWFEAYLQGEDVIASLE